MDPSAEPAAAGAPRGHLDLLKAGVMGTAAHITDMALMLLGRGSLSSSGERLPEDAPVVVGFSLLIMLGIAQAVAREGIALDTDELSEMLIAQQLAHRTEAAGGDEAAQQEVLAVSGAATLVPGQIVATAQGEVEGLFRTCYTVLPEFIQGSDEKKAQLMSIFGTALLVLLRSQVRTDD